MAERAEAASLLDRGEPPEPPPRHVLEEDALHWVLGAEGEDLLEPGLLQAGHQTRKL
jgi:hypothetical protein